MKWRDIPRHNSQNEVSQLPKIPIVIQGCWDFFYFLKVSELLPLFRNN